jgi:chemotaxis protein MotB
MKINLESAVRAAPLIALLSATCVSQSAYEQQGQQLEKARAEAAAQQAQIAKMQQEQKWVVAGDLLFPEGGYQLGPNAQAALGEYVPRLQNLQDAKVAVYGYTDNQPVGPALQRAGVANNIDLSSRRADNVVAYFRSQGGDPGIMSAKGFGDTRAQAAPNRSIGAKDALADADQCEHLVLYTETTKRARSERDEIGSGPASERVLLAQSVVARRASACSPEARWIVAPKAG